jgi:translation initiation factor IF-2
MRVYELARELGVKSKDILLLLEEIGVGGKTASSSVPEAYLGRIRRHFGRGAPAEAAEETAAAAEAPEPAAEAPAPPAPAPPQVAEAEEAEGEIEGIRLKAPFTVAHFATVLDTDAENVVSAAAGLGESVGVDDTIAPELAVLIGEQWGYTVRIEIPEVVEEEPEPVSAAPVEAAVVPAPAPEEEPAAEQAPPVRVVPRRTAPPDAPSRPPVVTVMGHVDHGKTTLLDAIRETNVTAQEAGAITQHIGAYQVEVKGRTITFIDTPGHEAFTAMRARGAQVTDIAVLVVAADDGVMPQTLEAIDHAKAAGVPIVVAVNKMDRSDASADSVKHRLAEEKGLVPEEWGGETIYVAMSALERTGIDELLEMIALVAEMGEFRAVQDKPAEGVVLEAELDRRRGVVATLLVQEGKLQQGDSLIAGSVAGKVRAMMDDRGRRVKEAKPSTPAQVLGLSDVPEASELFRVVESDREARALAEEARMSAREADLRAVGPSSMAELSQLFAAGEAKVLNLILKGDAQGTVEAIGGALAQLRVEEVKVNLLHAGVGEVTESDVGLAAATKPTIIIGFQVGTDTQGRQLAADEQVEVRRYDVIYDLLEEVRKTMAGMLEAVYEEVVVGRAETRALFRSSRIGTIAGCYVLEGHIVRGAKVRVQREGDLVFEGTLDSLRHLKDDVREIGEGFECGIALRDFQDFEVGDTIECVEEREIQRAVS